MSRLKELKQNSKSNFEKLLDKMEADKNKKSYNDDRYWKLTLKPVKSGGEQGSALIRFLPSPENEDAPYVKYWDHFIRKGKTGPVYSEKSLTTIGKPDPVGEYNSRLWASGDEDGARKNARTTRYVSNIYVISDSANPENNGKVFLFRYGKKLFEKIDLLMNPSIEGKKSVDPFDYWNGCDFELIGTKSDKPNSFPNYDQSSFQSSSPLLGGKEAALDAVDKQLYSLAAEVAPDKFKSYDELKAKLEAVLGAKVPSQTIEDESESEEFTIDDSDGTGEPMEDFASLLNRPE